MLLTCQTLNFRRENRELFDTGRYLPLTMEGSLQEHVCAFESSVNNCSFLVVVPLFCSRLIRDINGLSRGPEVWQDTRIIQPFDMSNSRYRNIFTGEELVLDQQGDRLNLALWVILTAYPVALLNRIDHSDDTLLDMSRLGNVVRCPNNAFF